MVRKTRQKPRPRPRRQQRQPRQKQNTKKIHAVAPTENAKVESHHYQSTMVFDGKTLVVKSQKDNEPVNEQVYTQKQLELKLPIDKLMDKYLDGKRGGINVGIQRPIPKEIEFMSVLPNPDDLGLLPPNSSFMKKYKLNNQNKTKRRRESDLQDRYNKEKENMRLIVQDIDDAALNSDYVASSKNRKHAHKLFDVR
jgi:hypothetical protein